jgi:signal transduction histidine kinase
MNQHLKIIQDIIQQNNLPQQDKEALLKAISDADKQWAITDFKLDRTEKVKKTTAILLEETIAELEQKRKAVETQNRELEIESSLEKVRTVAMGMRKRDDMLNICHTISKQLESLGINEIRNVQTAIFYKDKGVYVNYEYYRLHDKALVTEVDYTKDELSSIFAQHMMKGADEVFTRTLEGKEVHDWYNFQKTTNVFIDTFLEKAKTLNYYWFSLGPVAIGLSTYVPISEEDLGLFKRFRNVFGLAYRRYLDIEQAEAQAKEAQIEAALERVRSRAMAMRNSEELNALIGTVFSELTKLDLVLTRCVIWIFDPATNGARWWMSNIEEPSNPMNFFLKYHEHEPYIGFLNKWKEKSLKWVYDLKGQTKIDWDKFLFNETELANLPEIVKKGMSAPERILLSASFNNFGGINVASLQPLSEEHFDILLRFAKVFDLTYTRFNDLKQAEAQAKEAMIEAALERVRGKAMAMHSSKDLSLAASMVFTELRKIGINSIRCGVGLLSKESRKAQLYSATSSTDGGDSLSLIGWIELSNHPVSDKIYDSWLKNEDYFPELSGDQLISYYENLLSGLSLPSVPNWQDGQRQYGTFLAFSVGCLYAWSEAPFTDTEIKVLKRFAAIIDLTFRRYMELQTSEANARAAVKQAALDRIRADIASMRTISDLDRITPLIWNELTILGIPFIRCGVFIMDDSQKLIHTFLSTPDGKAIAAFHLPYDTPGNIGQVLNHWQDNKNYIAHWDQSAFIELAEMLVKQGAIASARQYMDTIPRNGFYLHFLPFLQGMLYVGNTQQLADEEITLIQSVADAFSTAYARYEDFNRLEAAKQQVDKTLIELKQAQTQLVQSEKMASLGELTAGIAHEIQNPLNFVNNFSDVSSELLDEMRDELEKGNYKDAIEIANDVRQNLEKITHHGKRADGIVKGMLQHSRTGSGQKELTDINALADEYLRLAYHGLRAKDKAFNAKFEMDFDPDIPKINVMPQDIGRVVLNLINNAFYAAPLSTNGRSTDLHHKHDPTVWVSTKKEGNNIIISVKDNGPGIPANILDKIFQPFFTTKPTGQGTGLGLSLSYDIIKAHGGTLKVESKEGEGSEFIIQLPV